MVPPMDLIVELWSITACCAPLIISSQFGLNKNFGLNKLNKNGYNPRYVFGFSLFTIKL
ncbi:hypothetical protein HCH_06757 [Hahella chejuensis KCTC 2396]|uniref:Uncharacterized protein n=1 Tax=Hahella chejuensis (strain KCTC 2396) TaxID=349521 RepID=Q2S7J1_HAHCH|nr:hypothetical protein HCH_06757 [Hahella chejuensis KCTC 2396]